MPISDYSTTPANNNAAPPNGFPEGMAPSGVNNSARQVMADIRSWYEDAQWIDYGYDPTYATTASFTVGGDRTSVFTSGRRVKISDATTLYGVVSSSSFSSPNTTVNVTLDSGSLTIAISAVAVGIITPSNNALPISILNNYTATTNPTVNDDSSDGYTVGSRWVNTSTDTLYECLDASAGAAIWRPSDEIKAGGSAGVVIKNSGGTTVATLGASNGTGVTFAGNINANAINSLTTQLSVANGGTGATALTSNNVILGNGTSAVQFVAPSTSGNVLTSNGTTWTSAALSTSGTFTPTVFGTSTAGTATYSLQSGNYQRIANVVFYSLTIVWSGHTGTGNMRFGGLPFTSAAGSGPMAPVYYDGIAVGAGKSGIAQVIAGTDTMAMYALDPAGSAAQVAVDAGGEINIAGFYFV